MPTKKTHLSPNHVTPYRFAKLKNVAKHHVMNKIRAGEILTDLVGYDKAEMIDLAKYKDLEFKADSRREPTSKIKIHKK